MEGKVKYFECSLCVQTISAKTSYKRIQNTTYSEYKDLFNELGHDRNSLVHKYMCRACEGLLKRRRKIEQEYENRHLLTKKMMKCSTQTPRKQETKRPRPSPSPYKRKNCQYGPSRPRKVNCQLNLAETENFSFG